MIIFNGNDKFAYRDPTCFYKDGTYYLFYTVSEKDGGYMYPPFFRKEKWA